MRTRPTRFYSNNQEKAVAKQIGGKKQSNSGATTFVKGDVVTNDFLIECKTTTCTTRSSFSIKKEWLEKNKQEALAMRKCYNALCFDYGDGQRYYIIDERLFKELLNYVEKTG